MLLDEAREFVAESSLDSSVNAQTEKRVDQSIQFGLGYFIELTECTRTTRSIAWSAGSNALDVTADVDYNYDEFFPGNVKRVTVDNAGRDPVNVIDFDEILRLIRTDGGTAAIPDKIAWAAPDDGLIYPQPDAAGAVKITDVPDLVEFTAGTDSPTAVTINVPDRFVRPALAFFCATYLHFGSAGTYLDSEGWRHGLAWSHMVKGKVEGGANSWAEVELSELQA